jgi:hypothetical protein
MTNVLKVKDASLAPIGDDIVEISAQIGPRRLWYRVPSSLSLTLRGDAFAVVALLPAMRMGVPLEIDSTLGVDPILLGNLEKIQEIFQLWGPKLGQPYKKIPVIARPEPAPTARKIMSFFSGGVDGTYTFLQAPKKIEQTVFVKGIDFQLDNPIYEQVYARNSAWLKERGVPLLQMSSNVRFVLRGLQGKGWAYSLGCGLSSFAHILQAQTMYIASGHTWKEFSPDGSHPLTDPLWSSSSVQIVHHGREATRGDKLSRIAQEPGALEILRVCWQNTKDDNCGVCEKCLRTMVLLRLLGLTSPNFPSIADLSMVSRFRPSDQSEAVFVDEAIVLANKVNDNELAVALRKSQASWDRHNLFRDIDKVWLGGIVRKLIVRGDS